MKIELRDTSVNDLEILFEFQTDAEAIHLAAFTPQDPTDKDAYIKKYTKLLSDETVSNKTIFFDDRIIGSIAKFEIDNKAEITYWICKNCWGKGIASESLRKFLEIEKTRPIYGRTAFDNIGSQKVLEKCGFKKIGTDKGFANARGKEIEEFIYKLD